MLEFLRFYVVLFGFVFWLFLALRIRRVLSETILRIVARAHEVQHGGKQLGWQQGEEEGASVFHCCYCCG